MYSPVHKIWKYIRYYLGAANGKGHGIHSPFVFELVVQVLNDERDFYAFGSIETLRTDLLRNEPVLQVEDHGAGSQLMQTNRRNIANMAASLRKPRKYSQLMFRLVDHYAPAQILELGTSFGITTAYMASANPFSDVTTMEADRELANMARANFNKLGIKNIRLVEGNFDDTLPRWINGQHKLDLAFIAGNHRYAPILRYFHQLKPLLHEYSMVVFDDIYSSREMEDAWNEVKKDPFITLSIDLFFVGIVFFRKECKVKQDMRIRF